MTVTDIRSYQYIPSLDALGRLALARALLACAPRDRLSPEALSALDEVRTARDALRAARKSRPASVNVRPLDLVVDRTIGAMYRRLGAFEGVENDPNVPEAAVALSLREKLFGSSLDSLKLPYEKQYEAIEEVFDHERELTASERASLEELVGASLLARAHAVHAEYGKALGLTPAEPEKKPRKRDHAKQQPAVEKGSVAEAAGELNDAVIVYATRVTAMASRRDPASYELVHAALEPIAKAKEEARSGATTAAGDEDEESEKGAGGAGDEKREKSDTGQGTNEKNPNK